MFFSIKINSWDKYRPRQDVKHASWLKLSNCFFTDPAVFSLSTESKLLFIYFLCEASKALDSKVKISLELIESMIRINSACAESALTELETHDLVQIEKHEQKQEQPVHVRTRTRTYVHDRVIREEKRREEKKRDTRAKRAGLFSDVFEKLYADYPKRGPGEPMQKGPGMKYCEKTFKTQSDIDKLKRAVQNYASVRDALTREDASKKQYTFNWNNFVKNHVDEWAEYADTPPPSEAPTPFDAEEESWETTTQRIAGTEPPPNCAAPPPLDSSETPEITPHGPNEKKTSTDEGSA